MPKLFAILALIFATAQMAIAAPAVRGEATFRLVGIKLYDARLYTENGGPFRYDAPFTLDVTYAKSFSKDALIKATLSEMRRMNGTGAQFESALRECFRDVGAGDRFRAERRSNGSTRLSLNGAPTCTVNDAGFAKPFFDIWLGNNSRDPSGSRSLRGE